MKALWRNIMALSAVLAAVGTPAFAQDATETAAPVQDAQIGPPQLRDFSLDGTVTRRAEEPAAPAPQQPGRAEAQRPSQPSREPAAAASRPDPAPRRDRARTEPSTASLDLPPPTRARPNTASAVTAVRDSDIGPTPAFAPSPAEPVLDVSQDSLPVLQWLLAAIALAGAAAWFFLRHRPRESYAGAGALAFQGPAPPAAPPVRTPPRPPAAPPPQPRSTGIVSTRLRPWLEIEFVPVRAVVDEQKAAIQFELSVFNSGSVPARDVLIEGCMFNAGPAQDQQIRTFFDNPVAQGERIPVIPPLQRAAVRTAVVLPREQVRAIEMEGRQLFVPLVAFNALYAWSRGEGQSSTSYLVGKDTNSEKLAPFRLDLGPRMFRHLGFREHALKLRK